MYSILNSLNCLFLTNLVLTEHLQTVRKIKQLAKQVDWSQHRVKKTLLFFTLWLQQLTKDSPIPSAILSGLLLSYSADTNFALKRVLKLCTTLLQDSFGISIPRQDGGIGFNSHNASSIVVLHLLFDHCF